MMEVETLNRFDRIVAIYIHLQSRRVIKAQDLADRFEVSLRTIYRDIRSLEASGVPISGEAGVGYSIMDGYRLPPIMFTREEASSFVAAEKLMQRFTDKTIGTYHESAMYKIKSVLKGKEKDWISAISSQVVIHNANDRNLFNENVPNALEILFESIAEKKQVKLHYQSQSSDESTDRIIEPVGLFYENDFWYIMAYCHLRNDYRQFRTDRMLGIKRTEVSFTREHGNIDDYRTNHEPGEQIKVRILMKRKDARFIKNSRSIYGFVSEKIDGEDVEMSFMTCDFHEGFARWYLMFADLATILEPESLKEKVRKIVQRSQERLSN